MPETAAFIDAVREVFGAKEINEQIRRGLDGAGTFWAKENRIEIGRLPAPAAFVVSGDALIFRLIKARKGNA